MCLICCQTEERALLKLEEKLSMGWDVQTKSTSTIFRTTKGNFDFK